MANVRKEMEQLGIAARAAARALIAATAEQKTLALRAAAESIRADSAKIMAANALDLKQATSLSPAMRDRLFLDAKRIAAMADGVATVAALEDPVGRVLASWDNELNGLHFEKVSVPLGVIAIIYESRPNVTADAAAIAIKAGNAVILRGGSDSFHSSRAILEAFHKGLTAHHLPVTAAQMVPTADREAVSALLGMHEHIDVIIPRGGHHLTARVREEAKVPTLLHLDGNCHIYIDAAADAATARAVVLNAKLRRVGVCGSLETLLLDSSTIKTLAPAIIADLLERHCELRGDEMVCALDPRILPASDEDWTTEYLAPILAIKTVKNIDEAIEHINRYGSHHTDAIITQNEAAAQQFTQQVDSAIVLVNASTQFADGGEFGFGAEIGIATGRLHARGPVGAAELTTYKYRVTTAREHGAIREG